MHNFIKCFRREKYGVWRCVESGSLLLPTGRIQVTPDHVFMRGTSFMNVEVAKLLDEHFEKNQSA